MRRLEHWLHQHIFKVGWLLTKNLRTTTVLYYTFFLPGVVLHELLVWLVAGVLNVRAERALVWPEAQAVAELKLNFVRLTKNSNPFKAALINLAPLIGALALLWLITSSVLNLNLVLALLRSGSWAAVGDAVNVLLLTPDVWLWVYLMFTIANTMMPDRQSLRGWRPVLIGLGVLIVLLYVVGIGQQVFLENLAIPISDGLSRLALIFIVIIVIDLIVTGVLGLLEAIIERITRDSATFQNGKLVAITREELLRQRQQARAKAEQQRARRTANQSRLAAPAAGPPSFYKLPLPIPGGPGRSAAEPALPARDESAALPAAAAPVGRAAPAVITGAAVVKTEADLQPEPPLQEAHIDLPTFAVTPAPAAAGSADQSAEAAPATTAASSDEETTVPEFDILADFADAINPQDEAQDQEEERL